MSSRLDTFFDAIYTGDRPQRWERVVTALGALVNARTIRIAATRVGTNETLMDIVGPDWPSALVREYDEGYFGTDPRMRVALQRTGETVSTMDLPDPEAWERSALCDFLDRSDIDARWGMLRISRVAGGGQVLIGASRGRRAGPFESAEIRDFDNALRHINHTLELETQVTSLRREKEEVEHLLDVAPLPTILTTSDLRVLHMNARAAALVRAGAGLRLKDQQLFAIRTDEHDELRAAALHAHARERGSDEPASAVVVHATDGKPLLVRAYALGRPHLGRSDRCVLVLSTGEPGEKAIDALLQSFKLTGAEQRLVKHLLEGDSLSGAARAFDLSIETVRGQLKSARAKIGVRTQAELLQVLTRYQT
jgi:DNA-binding CsgD family transcriptional regulator/PAS domain-containing protein